MFTIKFWIVAEIFMLIGPWAGPKMRAKRAKSHLYAIFKDDCVLEPSEASPDAFSNQAK